MYQIEGFGVLRLYVEAEEGVNYDDLSARFALDIKNRIGFTPLVNVVGIGELPRSNKKTRRVFDEREE